MVTLTTCTHIDTSITTINSSSDSGTYYISNYQPKSKVKKETKKQKRDRLSLEIKKQNMFQHQQITVNHRKIFTNAKRRTR